jgi:hypothetical protein
MGEFLGRYQEADLQLGQMRTVEVEALGSQMWLQRRQEWSECCMVDGLLLRYTLYYRR